jgi:hypothetical protein
MSSYTEGQVHQLMERFEKEGFTPEYLTKLGQFKNLSLIKKILDGLAEITPIINIIDCDANPCISDGCKVVEHKKGGKFEWKPEKVKLYLSPNQQKDGVIDVNKLHEELSKKFVFNANVLDFLLRKEKENQHLIPEQWKGKYVFFWGTVYRDIVGDLGVRYLFWHDGEWLWRYCWLSSTNWHGHVLSAVLEGN